MANESRDRILDYMERMYMEEGEDDESVGVEEVGGVTREIPLTFGDIRWLRANIGPIDPTAVEMVLAGMLAVQIGYMTEEWVTALRRASKAIADAHEDCYLGKDI